MGRAYSVGDMLPFAINVYDASGNLANATSCTISVYAPDGTTDGSHTISPTTTGVYAYSPAATSSGRWLGQWVTNGTNAGGEPQAFWVLPANPIVTVGEMRSYLDGATTANDDEISFFILSAVKEVESIAGPIQSATYTRTYSGGRQQLVLPYKPTAITSLTETGVSLTENQDYVVDYATGVISRGTTRWRRLFLPGQSNITVTYTAGPTVLDPSVQHAVKECVKYFWRNTHGNPQSFTDSFVSPAATVGVSEAFRARIRLMLGNNVSGPSVV